MMTQRGDSADAPTLTTQSSWDPLAYHSARQHREGVEKRVSEDPFGRGAIFYHAV